MPAFTHLHVHSHYSLLDGLPKIPELIERVKELGMDSVALTDHGNLYGAVEFYKAAKKEGIKPIIGAEMYVALEHRTLERPGIDSVSHHLVLLAKNQRGYENLVKLLTKAHLEGYYYRPRVDEELLEQHAEGLIALSGCLGGKIPRLLLAGKAKEAQETAKKYRGFFGEDGFYLELQHHPKVTDQRKVNEGLKALSARTGIPLVATADSHYLRPEDAEAQDVLMLINTGADKEDPERLTLREIDASLQSAQDMAEHFKDLPQAIENTRKIADLCDLELELGVQRLPVYPLPEGATADEHLRELCEEHLPDRYEEKTEEITERLEYELSVIQATGFAPYFLIVQDFVNWAKERRIVVGPGRGSAAGSLVSYILGITNADPLKYGLLFERFLQAERNEPPDIDLDFADTRRDEVIEYVTEKYGRDRVAQIITFGTMASRAVIRDVGRALGYEYGYCDRVAKLIPFGMTLSQALKTAEFKELYETDEQATRLIDLGRKLEGVARHASTHACGVVISSEPLDAIVPLQHPTQNDSAVVTQYEMHSILDIGLLKMDFLGLKNLSIIEEALKRVYVSTGKNVDIDAVPMDDEKVFELLRQGDTSGIFQIESQGMRRYLRELKPTHFEDIIAMVALYRPGPMDLIPDFIAGKRGTREVTYLHPKLEPILSSTYGIAVYQEQVLQMAREIAGFTYGEADVLRKAIGKKIKELLAEQEEKFLKGAMANGVPDKVARQLFAFIEPFARYGFNRAHATCYALIAYQTAWLKANYPLEFMSALLTLERNDVERIAFLIDETRKMGIEVLPPDINESYSFFSFVKDKNQIRFGLFAIKNVGEGVVDAIITEREKNGPYASIADVVSRVGGRELTRKAAESLIKAGVFDQMEERGRLLANVDFLLTAAREEQRAAKNGQRGLFEGTEQAAPRLSLQDAEPAAERDRLAWERELLGLYVSSHPLKPFRTLLERRALSISNLLNNTEELTRPRHSFEHGEYQPKLRIGGLVASAKRIITKSGKPMLFVNLEDLTDRIEVVVFPTLVERNPALFEENKLVLVTGRLDSRNGDKKFVAESAQELIET